MDADLDLLLIAVYCTAHDLLPVRAQNARRVLIDAEIVTLCVAQQLLGISSDEKFWAAAPKRLGHLFPRLIQRPGFVKRRQRLSDTIEALIEEFARHSPGFEDDLLVVDSTPVECGRSLETMRPQRARRCRGLRLLRQSFPLLLGLQAARPVRNRRHSQGLGADQPEGR
jgi:hypothetical protein